MSETKRREVLQLLREYQAYHAAFGGSAPVDETGVMDAAFGPAGIVFAGHEYTKAQAEELAESYKHLENAITVLKGDGLVGFTAWLMLLGPYLGEPGDSSMVNEWRKKRPLAAQWHDLAVEKLAEYLRGKDLFVLHPKRMTVREEKLIERRNDEFYGLYQRIKAEKREEGMPKHKANREAIGTAAEMCGYSQSRGYDIVRVREGKSAYIRNAS